MRLRKSTVTLIVLLVAGAASAASEVLVEDWSSQSVGSTGLPGGWQAQNWGTPNYAQRLTIVDDNGRHALSLKSANDGSTISKDIRGKVRVKETPLLEWDWKAVVLPKGANSCRKSTDDQAAQVFVVWPRFPEQVRSRIIGYVWDTTQPVGTICKSEKTGMVTYVVLRSGTADLNKWLTERRDVVADFKRIYGETPDDPAALSVATDSNDTNTSSEAMIGAIRFKSP